MSEERFDRLEKMIGDTQNQVSQMQTMMEQLIKMVGYNNAVSEELRARLDKVENKVGNLENKVDNLENKVGNLENKVGNLENKVDNLENKVDNLENQLRAGFSALTAMVNLLGEKVDAVPRFESKLEIFNDYLLNQAADIRMLKKAR